MRNNIPNGKLVMALLLCMSSLCQASQLTSSGESESVLNVVGVNALSTETTEPTLALLQAGSPEVSTLEIKEPEIAATILDFGTPITSSQLSDLRGGFDAVNNDMQLSGVVTNNSAVDVITGSNYITNGSFANSSGFPMVVQNSGSNVLIQNATIINLQYQ